MNNIDDRLQVVIDREGAETADQYLDCIASEPSFEADEGGLTDFCWCGGYGEEEEQRRLAEEAGLDPDDEGNRLRLVEWIIDAAWGEITDRLAQRDAA